jgi:hypothetical protein
MQRRRGIEAHPFACLKHSPVAGAGKQPSRFVELDRRQNDGCTVMLEWERATGNTRIVVADDRTSSRLVFRVPAADAGDALRHPFKYAL